MDRWFLAASGICLLASFLFTLLQLRGGKLQSGGINLPLIAAAFVLQSIYLYRRGLEVGACPLYTLSDLLVFLGWAVALMYLLTGPAFRLSLLGAFTAPLILALQAVALVLYRADVPDRAGPPNVWVELHASLSVVAYGAFGLAAVSGAMFLLQDYFLKKHRLSMLFFQLPPVEELVRVTARLALFGFVLLTVAFTAGLMSRLPVEGLKLWGSVAIWALYGAILGLRSMRRISSKRFASAAALIFVLAVLTLPAVHYLSRQVP